MAGTVHIVVGPSGAGKTERLLGRYRQILGDGLPGVGLWLAPTHRAAVNVRNQLLTGQFAATFAPRVMTFEHFARRVLEMSPEPIRPLSPGLKRRLIARIVAEVRQGKQLKHFEAVADSPGLIDVLSRFISELKRHEIWPDQLDRATGDRPTAADRELGRIYRRYQDFLKDYQLYDAEGQFWSAREQLKRGHSKAIEATRLVVADGFTDFTWTQHEILQLLAAEVDELWITLPLEADRDRRSDLFSKVHATLDELSRRHNSTLVTELPPGEASKTGFSARRHLEQYLFANPRQPVPSVSNEGIEFIAAGQAVDEIERVALRIKELLLDGDPQTGAVVRPQEIVVVFRSLDEAAARVREVFGEFGIPYAIESQPRLADAPVLKALRAVLEMHLGDWPYRSVRAIASNNFVRPVRFKGSFDTAKAAADAMVGEIQIPRGRTQLLAAAAKRVELAQFKHAKVAARFLTCVDHALAALHQAATPGEWAVALESLAQNLGMLSEEEDYVAFDSLQKGLLALDRLSIWLGEPPAVVPRERLLPLIDDWLSTEPLPGSLDETGRVRVLAAPSVRTLDVPYLFVAGLSEQSFPARQPEDAVLNDHQRRRLIDSGLRRLVPRAQQIYNEMLLFYEVVTRASRRLYLSFPAMTAKAEPLSPSPFVDEVARLFTVPTREPLAQPVPPSELSPIPRRKTRLFGARDLRVAAVDRALAGDIAALSALRAAPAQAPVPPSISRACVALRHRQDREQYGPYEGILTSPAARAALQKRFGPDQTLSASRLEEYATCPYRFWLTTVLGIRPPAEIGVEEDFRERGQLLHGAMAAAHRSLNEAAQRPVLPTGEFSQQFILGFRQALEAILETIARDNPWEAALRAVDHQLLSDLVERYIDHFAEYADEHGQSLHPAHFEVAFGLPDDGQGAPTTIGPLNVGDGNDAVKLCGRIDRVDLGNAGGRPVFGVVDYKSGKSNRYRPNKDGSINPSLMQLEIYALAVEQLLLTDAAPAGCGYWFVREKGYKSWIDYRDKPDAAPAKDWERRKAKLITTIVNLVRAIRDGQFPIHNDDHDCNGSCDFHKTCRVNHARSLEKTWQPVDLTTKTRRHEEDSE